MPTIIDPMQPFHSTIDLSTYVIQYGNRFDCRCCGETLVRIEAGGILGETLNELDAAVVLDHYLARHTGE